MFKCLTPNTLQGYEVEVKFLFLPPTQITKHSGRYSQDLPEDCSLAIFWFSLIAVKHSFHVRHGADREHCAKTWPRECASLSEH